MSEYDLENHKSFSTREDHLENDRNKRLTMNTLISQGIVSLQTEICNSIPENKYFFKKNPEDSEYIFDFGSSFDEMSKTQFEN